MIVLAKRFGQLGNRLWLHAHFIAAARHYGVELRNPSLCEYASLFPSTRQDLWCRFPAEGTEQTPPECIRSIAETQPTLRTRRFVSKSIETITKTADIIRLNRRPAQIIRLRKSEHCDLAGERFESAVRSERLVLAQGWAFRSKDILSRYEDEVRQYFQLDPCDQRHVQDWIADARRESDVLIGVHIRRGDYATFLDGKYYFENAEYARWMHQVQEHFAGQKVNFLICSNEQLTESDFPGLNLHPGPGAALLDMYALAETDFIIGPPSTFASWAAFMGQKPFMHLQERTESVVVPSVLETGTLSNKAA